jgi:DNA modification methylase
MKQQSFSGIIAVNRLYCGDCVNVLDGIENDSIDLIYIDPPFYSQRYYEVIWGEGAERRAFKDRWEGGMHTYLNYLLERCRKLRDKLKPTGSFYIHLDWHIGHYMKTELDKLFGYTNFRNEIVWHYRKWPSGFKQFQRNHDVIYFYSKSDSEERTFNIEYMERAASTLKRFGKSTIVSGYDHAGRRIPSKMKASESVGVPLDDVWNIGRVPPIKQLFPTQKPLPLLERIISVSSNPGDLVLDGFCGCGTTMEAAQRLGRNWVGIDISQTAIRVVENRLRKIGAPEPEVIGLVETEEHLRRLDPFEFQNWAINAVQGRHSTRKIADMGIDGFTFLENHPIQVKRMDNVGRPVIDNLVGVLEREKDKKGMVIAFGFTRGAIGEVARLRRESGIQIELLTCEQLLKGISVQRIMI